jgi:PAS domain S-box-containing protein
VVIVDRHGRYELVNQVAAAQFGKPAREIVGKTMFDLLPHDTAQAYLDFNRKLIESGGHREYEDTFLIGGLKKTYLIVDKCIQNAEGINYAIQSCAIDITARVQAEEALKESELRFREVLENSLDASYKRNIQTNAYDYLSAAFEQISGYSLDEMRPMSISAFLSLIHSDDLAEIESVFADSMKNKSGQPYQVEYRFRNKDGQYRWFQDRFTVMHDDRDHPEALIGSVRDITEQKKAEVALRESEEKYRLLFDHAGDAIFIHDQQGRMLAVNPITCDRLGYSHAELMSMVISQVDSPEEALQVPTRLSQLIEHGHFAFETVHMRKDGSLIPTEVNARRVIWNGRPVIMSICRDIADRKRAEEALQKAHHELENRVAERTAALTRINEELRMSEERYRTVADFTYGWEYWQAPDGSLPYVSPSCEQITGYCTAEFQADPGLLMRILHPEDRSLFSDHLVARSSAVTSLEHHELEFRIITRRGEERWISQLCRPVFSQNGNYLGLRASNRDITERRSMEKEILDIGEREQRRIGEDLHDGLGQQLTAIELLCSLLQSELPASQPGLKEQVARMDQFLRDAIHQTRMMAHDLMGFRLLKHGLQSALAEFARNVSSLGRLQCVFVCPTPVTVHDATIAGHLYYIAKEALQNATKHSQASLVTICLFRQDNICLQISDNGLGLPCPMPPNPGMGLQVMKHRASIMGALLKVESKPGHGVTITCTCRKNVSEITTNNED